MTHKLNLLWISAYTPCSNLSWSVITECTCASLIDQGHHVTFLNLDGDYPLPGANTLHQNTMSTDIDPFLVRRIAENCKIDAVIILAYHETIQSLLHSPPQVPCFYWLSHKDRITNYFGDFPLKEVKNIVPFGQYGKNALSVSVDTQEPIQAPIFLSDYYPFPSFFL